MQRRLRLSEFIVRQVKPKPENLIDIRIIKQITGTNRSNQANSYIGSKIICKFTDCVIESTVSKIEDLGYGHYEFIAEVK